MARTKIATGNITNRSPWQVTVRSQPTRNKQFPYTRSRDAEKYFAQLQTLGLKASLTQLETSFQLRVRRNGVKAQFITFDTLEAAEQAHLKIAADLSVSIIRDYAIATRHTLSELMQRYLDDVVPTHKGGDIEAGRLRRLIRDESFVDKKLAALDTEDLQDFITDRLTEVAPATVDRELDLISQVLRYADDVWKIAPPESPFKGLRRPEYFNERDRRLTPDEERRLLDVARNDENPYLEAAIILALETAMRRSELLSLTVDDINYEQRYAFLRDTKNGRSRKVPLSRRAMEVLRALPPDDDGRLLCLTANALKIGSSAACWLPQELMTCTFMTCVMKQLAGSLNPGNSSSSSCRRFPGIAICACFSATLTCAPVGSQRKWMACEPRRRNNTYTAAANALSLRWWWHKPLRSQSRLKINAGRKPLQT